MHGLPAVRTDAFGRRGRDVPAVRLPAPAPARPSDGGGSASLTLLRRHVSTDDLRALRFAAKINILGLGLLGLWSGLNTVLLPLRVEDTAPASLRSSALGLVSLLGVGFAALIQPFAGRISDVASLPDRRRPFVAAGALLALPALVLFGGAPTFAWLLLAYVVLQLAGNVAQAAFQAFIPDLVDETQRGLASGAKNGLTVLGAAVGLLGVRLLRGTSLPMAAPLAFLGTLLAVTALLTVVWTPKIPPDPDRRAGLGWALDPRALWSSFHRTFRERKAFRYAVIAQFLVLLGAHPAQSYLVYFLRDRFGRGAEERASGGLAAAIALAVASAVVAGALSDRIGRRRVLEASAVLTAVGLAGVGFAPTLPLVALAGGFVAVGIGVFQSVNWALMSDDIPKGQSAAAFGLANIATAGAGAIAGLFGPLIDALDATVPAGTYAITFGLAGLFVTSALVPLRRIPAAAADADGAEPRKHSGRSVRAGSASLP